MYSLGLGGISIIANIVTLPLIILNIGAVEYGPWLFMIALITYVSYADLGSGTAVTHFLARLRGSGSTRTRGSLIPASFVLATLAAIVSCLTILLVGPLLIPPSTNAQELVYIAAAATVSIAMKPSLAVLQGVGLFVLERQLQALGVVVKLFGTVLVCLFLPSVIAVAVVEAAALLVPALAGLFLVPVHLRRMRFSRGLGLLPWSRHLLSYGSRSLSVSLIGVSLLQGGTIAAGLLGTPAQVTYWNAAFRIYSAARQANGWIVGPFLPVLTRLFSRSKREAITIAESVTMASLLGTTFLCLAAIPIAPDMVRAWLGHNVPTSQIALCIVILLLGLCLNSIHVPVTMIGDAAGRPGVFFHVQLLWLILFASTTLLLFPYLDIVAIAIGISGPLPLIELCYLIAADRKLGLPLRDWWASTLRPVLLVLGPATGAFCLALLAVTIWQWPAGTATIVFCVIAAGSFVCVRRRLPLANLRRALGAEF